MNKYRYAIYQEEKTVFCFLLVHNKNRASDVFSGKATCHKDDEFDVSKGMDIAKLRCEESYLKSRLNHEKHRVTKLNKKAKTASSMADECKREVDCLKEELRHLQEELKNLTENS